MVDLRRLLATISARTLDAACAPRARLLFLPRLGSRPVDSRLVAATRRAAAQWVGMGHAVTEQPGAEWAEEVHALWPRLSATGLAWMLDKADDWLDLFLRGNLEARLVFCGDAAHALYVEGHALSATSLFKLAEAMQRLQHAVADVFAQYDFILTPATAALPWAADEPHPRCIDKSHRAARRRGPYAFRQCSRASCDHVTMRNDRRPAPGVPARRPARQRCTPARHSRSVRVTRSS